MLGGNIYDSDDGELVSTHHHYRIEENVALTEPPDEHHWEQKEKLCVTNTGCYWTSRSNPFKLKIFRFLLPHFQLIAFRILSNPISDDKHSDGSEQSDSSESSPSVDVQFVE